MFYKTMGVACDGAEGLCDETTETQGPEATMAKVMQQARKEGWSVSAAGHYCPEHRRRPPQG